jgi:hypothetical protein
MPPGKPDSARATEFAVLPLQGVIVKLKFAIPPAAIESAGVGRTTLKSSNTIFSAALGPPPGAGLFTTMFRAPL